jgi:hypothetical protein
MLEADDGRKRDRSEKGITATAWLSTAGVQLALLCFLLLIVGGAAQAGADDSAKLSDASWARDVRRVDEALARGDRSEAEWAWHDAYAHALGAREWKGLLAVGDAYFRIADAVHGRKAGEVTARSLYLAALYRARQEGALQGVLEAAERFRQLGDREMVTQCLAVADRLAVAGQGAPGEQVRLEIFRTRWDTRWLLGPRPAWENPTLWLFPDASVGP